MSHIELILLSERNPDIAKTFQEMQDYCTKLICAAYTLTPEDLYPERTVKLRSVVALDRPRPRELVLSPPDKWRHSYLHMSEVVKQTLRIMFYNQLIDSARRDYERFRQRQGWYF